MTRIGLALLAMALSIDCLRAQVTVEVSLDQEQFLPGEALPARVRITNRSGQTLRFGPEQAWLTFSIESQEGLVVVKNTDAPVKAEFTLESSKRAKLEPIDLAPHFNLHKPGRYSIVATATIQEWNQQIVSAPISFDIIEGSKLWEQEVGLPKRGAEGSNQAPEVRRYVLHQANYLGKKLMLYVQVSDQNRKVLRVFPVGPMLSFGQPEAQIDRSSNLHVLYQIGPRSFSYIAVNPSGDMILRQTYDFTSRPRIKADAQGNLKVVGGTRRFTSGDLPLTQTREVDAESGKN